MLSAHSLATRQEAEEEAPVVLPTNENSPELVKLRHTTAHVMAMAVQRLFPKAQVTIGPWIENGFYYDFDMQGEELLDKDLKAIKKEMIKIINKGFELRREVVPREEARKRIDELGEPYKLELLDAIPEVRLKALQFTRVD
jgi:threonyl-tRNA synthetase